MRQPNKMETDRQLKELLERIEKLSDDIERSQAEVNDLKATLYRLGGTDLTGPGQQGMKRKTTLLSSGRGFENFIGLKLIHFIGIIVLIIGITIGVKYAIDINLISPVFRIVLAYIASALLLFISLRLRKQYELFSMILFSGGMASAYFTTYAAFAYYALMPWLLAFLLMLVFTLVTVYTALRYKRQEIAILGLVGAYGIPFFVSGRFDTITALFSYVLVINIGVLVLTFKKYWLSLIYIAF